VNKPLFDYRNTGVSLLTLNLGVYLIERLWSIAHSNNAVIHHNSSQYFLGPCLKYYHQLYNQLFSRLLFVKLMSFSTQSLPKSYLFTCAIEYKKMNYVMREALEPKA